MSFVAEWVSLEEMKVLQGVSVLTSFWVREWEYKDILNDIDGRVWEDFSEDWQKCQTEEKVLSCEVRHRPSRGTRANKPNGCATEIGVCLTPSPQNKLRSFLGFRSFFRSVLNVRWKHLAQGVQEKVNSSRANVGGIVWRRNGGRLPVSSDAPHDVREGKRKTCDDP